MLPTGSPRLYTLKYATKVGSIDISTSVHAARNLLHTIVQSPSGRVISISMVPPRRSSASERIVMAGIRNRYKNGPVMKRPSSPAYP